MTSSRALFLLGLVGSTAASRSYPPTIEIQSPYLTSKWVDNSSPDDLIQIIEMEIYNAHEYNYLTLADTLNVTLQSDSLELVVPGTLERLAPQQAAVLQIGVRNSPNTARGSQCSGTIVATWGQEYGSALNSSVSISGYCGIPDYNENSDFSHHWNPDWYNEVKFGIFIHWGVYSVPAYGSVSPNEDYAEWYWCRMHDSNWKTDTYQWHENHYGQDFNYDQFLDSFTAAAYDPAAWVDLIANAGARYMVPVTKHHEGWVTFDTNTTDRSFNSMGPKRDLLGELLDAAKTNHPEIRRGTYFSLPEWYNPAFAPYRNSNPSFGGGCFGFPDENPYTNASLEYTGYIPVEDFIVDVQLVQMNELAYNYDTDIMWCDIEGTPNNSTIMLSNWFDWARENGRQVTYNQRCGPAGDFDTPEYSTNSDIVSKKWETNRGMDPFSFGYNAQTPDDQYLTGEDIVQSLVDVISKNGNFLLDIGPTGNGSIPDIMSNGLLDAGSWIIPHGDGIYGTRYWNSGPGTGNFRYTVKDDAFYIFYLTQPPTTLTFSDPIPWLPGDTVTALGGEANGTTIDAGRNSTGFYLNIPQSVIEGDEYVWVFKISYTSDW